MVDLVFVQFTRTASQGVLQSLCCSCSASNFGSIAANFSSTSRYPDRNTHTPHTRSGCVFFEPGRRNTWPVDKSSPVPIRTWLISAYAYHRKSPAVVRQEARPARSTRPVPSAYRRDSPRFQPLQSRAASLKTTRAAGSRFVAFPDVLTPEPA